MEFFFALYFILTYYYYSIFFKLSTDYESVALPLSYAGNMYLFTPCILAGCTTSPRFCRHLCLQDEPDLRRGQSPATLSTKKSWIFPYFFHPQASPAKEPLLK
jgi:hypothetical protein